MDPGHRAASVKFLIRDRAGQFTESSGAVSMAAGVTIPQPAPGTQSERRLRTDDRHPCGGSCPTAC